MINETLLVEEWLSGKNIDNLISYRMCYLISKWYYEHEITDMMKIRENILHWADVNKVKLDTNLNECISNALKNTRRLSSDNEIRINDNDIYEITRRFDRKNPRICALAFLCYAKQFADQNRIIEVPFVAFGRWIGISYNNINSRYLEELQNFKYLERYKGKNTKVISSHKTRSPKFRMLVPITNTGNYILKDNNILELYDTIFSNYR